MGLTDALWLVADRSRDQTDELIQRQVEIVETQRERGDLLWVQGMNLLGDAYRDRAERFGDDGRTEDLERAVVAYREALHTTSADDEYRDTFIIDLANTLTRLPERSRTQLDELIALREELTQRLRQAGDPRWVQSASLLGDAYREHAELKLADTGRVDSDTLARALGAHREALHATPAGAAHRLHCVIGLANALWLVTGRSREQIDELIELQLEIVATRRDNGDPGLPHSAKLLGDAYRERAERREDAALAEDIERALVAYREALRAAPHDNESRLAMTVDLANALLTHAAITRSGGQAALAEATDLVADAVRSDGSDLAGLQMLLPVLRAQLKRQGRWHTGT